MSNYNMTHTELSSNIIKTQNHGTTQEYNWIDDFGFHQYYGEIDTPTLHETIKNFKYEEYELNKRTYSWTDNLGFHQYHCDL